MKKTLSVISVLLISAILALAVISTSAAEQKTLTVLGDSIASGYGLEDINDSYGAIIAAEKGYNLINKAIPGDKTSDLLDHIANDEAVKNSIKKADIVAVSIGGNDFLFLMINPENPSDRLDILKNGAQAACVRKALATFTENLNTIASEIRKLNQDCEVIINIQYNPLYANALFSSYADKVEELAPEMKAVYNSIPEKYEGFHTADLHAVFGEYFNNKEYDIIQKDGIHPSVKGHAIIAETLLSVIDTLDLDTPVVTESTAAVTETAATSATAAAPSYIIGDADCSGIITVKDATAVQKHIAGMELASFDENAADADLNGTINVKDATAVQKFIAGILTDTLIGTNAQ